jgi:hypothetical protein
MCLMTMDPAEAEQRTAVTSRALKVAPASSS